MNPPIYFAFPDGVFHYLCAECTALCCRGHGFGGSLGREMGRLLALHPELANAVVERRGELLGIASTRDGCFFLDSDNLCRIEKERGRSAKPGVCVLFPFNSFSLIGSTLVVSPNFLCPLRLHVPARPGAVEGTHAQLEPLVRESGLAGEARARVSLSPARLHPSAGVRSVLAREVGFRDRCGAALGVDTFAERLQSEAADPAGLARNAARGAALLGLPVAPRPGGRDSVDDLLLAVAPTMRLGFLRLPADGILLALALAEHVVRRLAALSPAAPTPQRVAGIISSILPALHLLGCAGVPVEVGARGRPKAPPFGDPALVFAAYRLLRGVREGHDILDILEAATANLPSVADRTAFLVEMGGLIGPSLRRQRRVDAPGGANPSR